jgi:hypothetical protein
MASDARWILVPIRIEGEPFIGPCEMTTSSEHVVRAYNGPHFADAESAFTWLELIGDPDDDESF